MTPPSIAHPPQQAAPFHEACAEAIAAMRDAVVAAYESISLNIEKPQEASRLLQIDKSLAWKVSRMATATDPMEAASLVPGAEALRIVAAALEGAGAKPTLVQAVTDAAGGFEAMVKLHAGDRATLRLLLDGLSTDSGLAEARKLAFRGLSGLWGLQARMRSGTVVLAPNRKKPELLDLAIVGAWHDVRRLRPIDGWPLFEFRSYQGDEQVTVADSRRQPIEPPPCKDAPYLVLKSFSSPSVLPVRSSEVGGIVRHELTDGPVGINGSGTFVFGGFDVASADRYSKPGVLEFGEVTAAINIPTETLLFDILAHKDMPEVDEAEVLVYGRPFGELPHDPARREQLRLPVRAKVRVLRGGPSRWGTELFARHGELCSLVCARLGHAESDFRLVRLEMDYPPMPSTVIVRYPLAPPPS